MKSRNLMRGRLNRQTRCRTRRIGGFTLVEIMIVVFIIATLLNIASPAFIHARDVGQARSCVANLHNIELAKEQFAIDNNAADNFLPTWSNLSTYVNSANTQPLCPANGAVYNINNVNTLPSCSYGGPVGLPHLLQ
jgi:prepilin-type N-terminal cleavage/methylation domain-containing protein